MHMYEILKNCGFGNGAQTFLLRFAVLPLIDITESAALQEEILYYCTDEF